MTNEEAIKVLLDEWKCIDRNDGINCDRKCESCDLVMDSFVLKDAYNMAIKALEQEPCEDAISRQAVLDLLEDTNNGWIINEVSQLPSVNPQPCEDAISRQALLDAFGFSEKTRKWGGDHSGYNTMMLYEIQDIIESQPSVKPQESSITWVTGADGAKIAFWDVPVWKVTKICEILGEPQERNEE